MSEMSIRQAVETKHYSKQHYYNLILSGRVRARKVPARRGAGYEWRIDVASLNEYIKAHRKEQ